MKNRTLIIEDETALAAFAARLRPHLKAGDVVALKGGLGAGKTAFARALIRLCLQNPEEEVPSPTFTLVQTYETPEIVLWHFDLYRLEGKEEDILELGWEDAMREGICLVEWPERLGRLLPKNRLEVEIGFDPASETKRHVILTGHGTWASRLERMMNG